MSVIEYAREGHRALLTINRPEARNAVDGAVAAGLEAAIDRLEADPDVWVAILTGAPPAFSAGADLKMVGAGRMAELSTTRGGFAGIVRRERTKPIIAAVDGPAFAGGTEIVLACDLVVASTAARFGLPEVKRGLVAGAGGLFRLPARIPFNVAMECALTGEPISAEEAHRFGLVNHLCPPGEAVEAARALAARVEACAPVAVRASRRAILGAAADPARGWELTAQASAEATSSQDLAEGVAAFLEKRPPVWTGR